MTAKARAARAAPAQIVEIHCCSVFIAVPARSASALTVHRNSVFMAFPSRLLTAEHRFARDCDPTRSPQLGEGFRRSSHRAAAEHFGAWCVHVTVDDFTDAMIN